MITKADIKRLDKVRKEKARLEKLDKELTAKIISEATETEKAWKDISFIITERVNTSPIREEIKKLPNWERFFKTSTYKRLDIKTGK